MKILLVVDSYGQTTNGTSITGRRFASNLILKGHEVRVLSNASDDGGPIKVFELKTRYMPIVTEVCNRQNMFFSKPDKKIIAKALDGVDFVHLVTPWKTSHVVRKMAKKLNIPVTCAFHIDPENITYGIGLGKFGRPLAWMIHRFKFRRYFNKVETIHCPSQMIALELKKHRYHSQLKVISNGVDDEFFADHIKSEDNMVRIVAVGRYAREKQQRLIIKAISNLEQKDRIHITFAGSGPMKKKLEKYAKKMEINAEFNKFSQADLREILKRSDYYIHAANIEVEGISVLEAIASGALPIIADAPKSASKQFAINRDHLFESLDADSLTARLRFWLNRSERYHAEARRQYKEYIQKYRLSNSISLFEDMMKSSILSTENALFTKEHKKEKYYRKIKPIWLFNIISGLFYFLIAAPLLFIFLKVGYRLKIRGRRNFRRLYGGAVIISNHVHTLDSPMAMIGLLPRRPVYTSIPENFKMPVAGFFVKILGAVPIPTNVLETKMFFHDMKKKVFNGKYIHMFPEGNLVKRADQISPFKRGAFKIAVDASVPIIPIAIRFVKRRSLFYKKLTYTYVTIGQPIFADFTLTSKDAIELLMNQSYEKMNQLMSVK